MSKDTPRSPGLSDKETTLRGLVVLMVPLASLLSALVQPMVGKHLLPLHGGALSTWLASMLYFQSVLLGGYGLAVWLLTKPHRLQARVLAVLSVVGLFTLHMPGAGGAETPGLLHVLLRLALGTLPAMLLLFCLPTVMHAWYQGGQRGRVPYHLYAFSNLGSLGAILLYPFLLERWLGLAVQSLAWRFLFFLLIMALFTAAYLRGRLLVAQVAPVRPLQAPVPPPRRILPWIALSGLGCLSMLAATDQIATEIGSTPLAWAGPFGLYLLSFTLVFSGLWRTSFNPFCLGLASLCLSGYLVTKGLGAATVNGPRLWWLLGLSFTGSLLTNSLLFARRPDKRFDVFYLALAAGGVLGGLLIVFVLPVLFQRPYELLVCQTLLVSTGVFFLFERRTPPRYALACGLVGFPVAAVVLSQAAVNSQTGTVTHLRNLYGYLMIEADDKGVVLSNATTSHGSQIIDVPEARRVPTLYYGKSSGAGTLMRVLQEERPTMRVGVVGLGAGTLAAYGRTGDLYHFWEINPAVEEVARRRFTYLSDAHCSVQLSLGDGRLGLAADTTDYDLILIDAFCGDAIPAHLLTVEALGIYQRRLVARNGVLLVHTSNRYSDVFPCLAETARLAGLEALRVGTEVREAGELCDYDPVNTEYILISTAPMIERLLPKFPLQEEDGRVTRGLLRGSERRFPIVEPWLDDRNSSMDMLQIGKLLRP